jgi:hypothetical protein
MKTQNEGKQASHLTSAKPKPKRGGCSDEDENTRQRNSENRYQRGKIQQQTVEIEGF